MDRYHVLADPPGAKIGCGGSTLVVLSILEDIYSNKLDECIYLLSLLLAYFVIVDRVLLIHAGGYSKRLPNHSTGGKIFCPVPFNLTSGITEFICLT